MSLILDALRKAERERNLGQPPILPDAARPPSCKPVGRPLSHARALALAALALGLLTITILFWPSHEESVVVADETVPEEQFAEPEPEFATEPEPVDAALPPPPVVAQVTPAAPEVQMSDGPQSLDDVLDPDAVEEPARSAVSAEAGEEEFTEDPKSSAAARGQDTNRSVVAEDENVPPEEAEPEEPPAEPEIKRLRDQPVAYRSAFPPMKIEVHVYDPDPLKRWFMIGGKRYIEGSKLPEGPRVVGITEDGIVFNYRGETSLYALHN